MRWRAGFSRESNAPGETPQFSESSGCPQSERTARRAAQLVLIASGANWTSEPEEVRHLGSFPYLQTELQRMNERFIRAMAAAITGPTMSTLRKV
jgi:hypothetical protein